MDNSRYTDFEEFYEDIDYDFKHSYLTDGLQEIIEHFEKEEAEVPALASFRTLLSAAQQLIKAIKDGQEPQSCQVKQDQIYREAWKLLDQERWNHMEHKPMIFAVDNLEAELEPQHLTKINDYQLECIFNTIRTHYPYSKDQRNALHQAILSDEVPMYLRATLLSAMTLNVLEWFDADLLECMYTYTLDDQPAQLRQQSWTALFLCGMVHSQRIMHYPRLREEYLLLCEIEPAQLEQLQRLLLPLREYQSFSRDLHKLVEGMQQKALNEEVELNEEDEEDEEGKREFIISNNSETFKQFLDLMHSNVDTGYYQFKLMSKMGFFSMDGTDHHWLMPFDSECEIIRKAIEETPELGNWYQILLHNLAQTNTDKYATFLMMSSMPQRMKDLDKKLSELHLPEGKMAEIGADQIMQIHLQDLYRFFTLSKTGKTLRNPFKLSPDLSAYKCFGEAFNTADNLRTVAEYLVKAERYKDAAYTYDRLLELEITQENLKNAILCMQHTPDFSSYRVRALALRCNQLYPGDEETLQNLIMAYGHEDPLMETYHKEALEYFPDSVKFLKGYGMFLNLAKRYAEALNPLYKAFMIDEKDEAIIKELALAHARLGQKDKAYNLIRRVSDLQENEQLLSEILSN